jgi:hypothetical protein
MSRGADTKANTRGGGALELGDSRLFEDSSERGGALGPDVVVIEAAKHGEVGAVRDDACQWALTEKRTLRGGGALQGGDLRLLEDGSERSGALVSDAVPRETAGVGFGSG